MAKNLTRSFVSVNSLQRSFPSVRAGLSLVKRSVDERIRELAHRQAEAERALDPDISEHEAPWAVQAQPLADPLHWTKGIKQRAKLPGISFEPGVKPDPAPTKEEIEATSKAVRRAIRQHLDRVDAWMQAKASGKKVGKPPVLVLNLPVGVGKTQAIVELLREEQAKRPLTWCETPDGEAGWGRAPTLFLAPSYKLLAEVEGRLQVDGELPSASVGWYMGKEKLTELGDGCRRMDEVRTLTSAGFAAYRLCRQVVKAKDGSVTEHVCPYFHECAISTQHDHYSQNPMSRGRWEGNRLVKEVPEVPVADVVLMPHAYMTQQSLPYQLARPRLWVVDESPVGQLLAQAAFPLSVLEQPCRMPPRLTAAERDANIDANGLYAEYLALCQDVGAALRQDVDVADAVLTHAEAELDRWAMTGEEIWKRCQERRGARFDWRGANDAVYERAAELVKLAKRIARAAKHADNLIDGSLTENPNPARVKEIASMPSTPWAHEEWQLWDIAEARINLLHRRAKGERKIAALAELGAGRELLDAHHRRLDKEAPLARDRERRVGYDRAAQMVELGWRHAFAWPKAPGIILDASANEELYRILFGADFCVEFVGIEARLRLRTILVAGQGNSTSSLLPPAWVQPYDEIVFGADGKPVGVRRRDPHEEAAGRRLRLQRVLAAILRHYAGLPVLVGSTKAVEEEMRKWPLGAAEAIAAREAGLLDPFAIADASVRFGHFGAFRGLDFAKNFAAAVCVGKLELPPDVLRRLGMALCYDQPERADDVLPPRRPSEENDPTTMVRRRVKMRDGRVCCIDTRVPRNRFERLVLEQKREEEIVQFAGRLRAYHKLERGDEPHGWQTLWLISNVVPEGLVLDDVLHIEDLARRTKLDEVAVANGGCVSSRAWAAADFVRSASAEQALHAASEQLRCMGLSENHEPPPGWASAACKRPGRGAPYVVYVDLTMTDDPVEAALEHLRAFGLDVVAGRIIRQSPLPDAAVLAETDTRASREERLEAYGQAAAEVAAELPGLSDEELAVAIELRRYERHSVAEGVVLRPTGETAPSADEAPPVRRAA